MTALQPLLGVQQKNSPHLRELFHQGSDLKEAKQRPFEFLFSFMMGGLGGQPDMIEGCLRPLRHCCVHLQRHSQRCTTATEQRRLAQSTGSTTHSAEGLGGEKVGRRGSLLARSTLPEQAHLSLWRLSLLLSPGDTRLQLLWPLNMDLTSDTLQEVFRHSSSDWGCRGARLLRLSSYWVFYPFIIQLPWLEMILQIYHPVYITGSLPLDNPD